MEVGQNPGDFYRNLDIGSPDALLNKSESFMPFAVINDKDSVEYNTEPIHKDPHATAEKGKRRPLAFRQDTQTLEFLPIQEDDSGISDSPRTTPEPVEPESLSLADFTTDFTFESRSSSPEILSKDNKVINEKSEQSSELNRNELNELKVTEADPTTNSKIGQNFEGPTEHYDGSSLSR